jgi:outer membrane lipopolysaccharide assembly protein LptE/RlpB
LEIGDWGRRLGLLTTGAGGPNMPAARSTQIREDEVSSIPAEVANLVERFTRNRESYKNPAYNETQVRREFLDPLFKALGWDVEHAAIQRQIDATDRQIDQLVYELYGLTDDEIKIVEEATQS